MTFFLTLRLHSGLNMCSYGCLISAACCVMMEGEARHWTETRDSAHEQGIGTFPIGPPVRDGAAAKLHYRHR